MYLPFLTNSKSLLFRIRQHAQGTRNYSSVAWRILLGRCLVLILHVPFSLAVIFIVPVSFKETMSLSFLKIRENFYVHWVTHRSHLPWQFYVDFLSISKKCWDTASNQATTVFSPIFPNSILADHPAIRQYMVWTSESLSLPMALQPFGPCSLS
jgi:hypothetical protein